MKLARLEIAGRITTAVVNGDAVWSLDPLFGSGELSRSLDAIVRAGGTTLAEIAAFAAAERPVATLRQVKLLAPLTSPRKIVAIGSNYPRPNDDRTQPGKPVLFFKPPTSLCGPNDPITLPPDADLVIGEVELAVVIGKDGDRIAASDAMAHVFGLMVANDVTAPEILLGESARNPLFLQQSRGKGFRTFCPIGPWIETLQDGAMPPPMQLEQRVDDFVEIRGETSQMLIDLPALLADISSAFGLEAGDIVLTGSPPPLAGKRTPLAPGATLYSSIATIGELANPVRSL